MINIENKIVSVRLKNKVSIDEEKVIVTDVKLPSDAPARMKTLRADGKKWYMTVVYLPNSEVPYALFCSTNNREKGAQTNDAVDRLLSLARSKGILEEHVKQLEEKMDQDNNVNKLTRSISLLLRHRVGMASIVNELETVDNVFVGSFLFQIKKFLSQYIKDGEKVEGKTCGECGSKNLIFTEGCMKCVDCGTGACG